MSPPESASGPRPFFLMDVSTIVKEKAVGAGKVAPERGESILAATRNCGNRRRTKVPDTVACRAGVCPLFKRS